ncbi:fibronectin type III domain-containing protein [Halorussus sp. AFM4]|uniref:fibronectin type III domain-containing protein n=1 Tax=Halorussus sp. AFM4 TaxID=3421651 RepID=UPI003EBC4415
MAKWYDSFEDGDASGWTVADGSASFSVVSDYAYDGSYSYYGYHDSSPGNLAYNQPSAWDGGKQISEFYWAFREGPNSAGCKIAIQNTDYNDEIEFWSSSPEWQVTDGDGTTQLYSGDGLERWVVVYCTFDWANANYTVEFEDQQSGTTKTHSGNLGYGNNAWRVFIRGRGTTYDAWNDYIGEAPSPPSAPSNTSQTIDADDSITVTWTDNSDNEDNFRVQVSEDGSSYSTVATPGANSTSYTYSATPGTNTHRFRVRAENTAGNSSWDYSSTKRTDATGLAVDATTDSSVDLSWTGADDESGYHVYRAEASGSTQSDYTQVADLAAGTSTYSDTGLENGEKYYYRVAAYYSTGDSQLTGEVAATTSLPAPTLDSLDATTEDEITVNYTLNDNSSDGNVEIVRSTDGTTGSVVATISNLSKTSYTDTGLSDGEKYYYTVRRNTDHVTDVDSSQASATTVLPAPSGLAVDGVTGDQATISWSPNHDYGNQRVEVKQTDASTWTVDGDGIGLTTSQYTTSHLLDGEKYDVRVVAYTDHDTAETGTVQFTTELPEATIDSLDNGIEDEVTVNWTDVIDYGEYRVEFRETSDTDWLTALSGRQTITAADGTTNWTSGSNATISTVSTPSEDGTAVRGVTDAPSTQGSRWIEYSPGTAVDLSSDNYVQFWYQTDETAGSHALELNDGSSWATLDFSGQLTAGEGQLVQIDLSGVPIDLTSIGQFRWLYDGDGTGVDKTIYVDSVLAGSATVGQATTSITTPSLEDGEQYEYRIRSETEHVTQSWSAAVSITTAFPTPTNTTADSAAKTSIDISWGDQSDNEDGFRISRAREYDYGWGPFQQIDDLAPNTTQYTDTTVSPGNTYKYQVEAYTEDSTSAAETGSISTPSSGLPRERVQASGWTVKVEHPSGQTLEPRLLDDPQFTPVLNGYPRVEVPVPRDEKWQASAFENAKLSVWQDGRILPIDELVSVRMEPGRTILEGRGGSELRDRVQAEYTSRDAHLAAEDLITANTSYTANVDAPGGSVKSDTLLQKASDNASFNEIVDIPASTPAAVQNGGIELLQTAWSFDAVDEWSDYNVASFIRDSNHATANPDSTDYGNEAVLSQNGHYIEWQFTPQYDMAAGAVGAWARLGNPNDITDLKGLDITISSPSLGTKTAVGYSAGYSGASGDKWEAPHNTVSGSIPAGETATVRVEVTDDAASQDVYVDIGGGYDGRYSYRWHTEDTMETHSAEGPEDYPDAVDVELNTVNSAYKVVGGRVDGTFTDTSNGQGVALSNDGGSTWKSASNTADFETSFSSTGTSLTFRVTLSRYRFRNTPSPKFGFRTQRLDSFKLYGDLQDTPVLDQQKYDGSLQEVLTQIADYGNFIWEVRRDRNGWSIEWTQPGQRQASGEPGIAEYAVQKSVEKSYEKSVIKGSAQPVRGESFSVSSTGTWKSLDHGNLVPATDRVYDPSTGEVFTIGDDYDVDRSEGQIKILSSGSMSTGTTYEIDYQYKTEGSYTLESATDPDTIVRTIPNLASNQACSRAALYLIQRIQDPLWEASVTVPKMEAGRSLVDDLLLEGLPTQSERLEIREIEQTPQEVVLRLGSRQSVAEVINDIQSRVSVVSDRV